MLKVARNFLKSARGLLVFPSIFKAGIGIGSENGEDAFRIGGKIIDYYSTAEQSTDE